MNRKKRSEQFSELCEAFDLGLYNDLSALKAQLITPSDLHNKKPSEQSPKQPVEISFIQNSIVPQMKERAEQKKAEKIGVLVFCSAKNPGGGIIKGSTAQEEDISLHSNWYFKAREVQGFYLEKKASAINTDNMIYLEHGYLLKDESFKDITPLKVSFIGATAVNINGMIAQKINTKTAYETMSVRIENMLILAQNKDIKHLMLGAWGCGVFGLEPIKIAQIFKEKIEKNIFTGNIEFVIKDKDMLDIFERTILQKNFLNIKKSKP